MIPGIQLSGTLVYFDLESRKHPWRNNLGCGRTHEVLYSISSIVSVSFAIRLLTLLISKVLVICKETMENGNYCLRVWVTTPNILLKVIFFFPILLDSFLSILSWYVFFKVKFCYSWTIHLHNMNVLFVYFCLFGGLVTCIRFMFVK